MLLRRVTEHVRTQNWHEERTARALRADTIPCIYDDLTAPAEPMTLQKTLG